MQRDNVDTEASTPGHAALCRHFQSFSESFLRVKRRKMEAASAVYDFLGRTMNTHIHTHMCCVHTA